MRGRPGRVRPPHGDRLHPPDPRHHALLPRVCCQGGAGENTVMQILGLDLTRRSIARFDRVDNTQISQTHTNTE